MPKTMSRKKTCAVCGKPSPQPAVRNAERHGSPDLDTRPPADVRFSIDTQVQKCPSCGYCFYDLAKGAPGAAETVNSETYRKQLGSASFPKLADSFLCWSLIEEQAGNFAGAGWACVYAAWVCDDAADFKRLYGNVSGTKMGERDEAAAAKLCRQKAVLLLKRARDEGQGFGAQAGAEEALMADLLRRIARFDSAAKMVKCGLEAKPIRVVETVLEYEQVLAGKGDIDVHTVAEAIKWKGELEGPATEAEKGQDATWQSE
ncbi:MAG: hypothetical protein HYY32_06550 [Chloroflexi bacterium]|nr:hypothetical protein [Chloroflexota bacterium]